MRKRTAYKPKKTTSFKRKPSRKRTTAPALVKTVDTTVRKINPGTDRIVRLKKALRLNQPYLLTTISTAGTTGFQITNNSVGVNGYGNTLTFDPAGQFGNNSGLPGVSLLKPAAIPEWAGLTTLYAFYRVKKIMLNFSAYDNGTAGLLSEPPVLYIRYLNQYAEPSDNSINLITISEEKNWIRKIFSAEHPTFNYSFYPKVMTFGDNQGLTTTDARIPATMKWTNVATPVELYGIKFYAMVPTQSSSSAVCMIQCDITYDIEFKTQD